MSRWIHLPHLDDSFPDYEKAFAMVDAVLDTDPSTTVCLLVTRSTAASLHVCTALRYFGPREGYEVKVDGRQHTSYRGQTEPEWRLEVQVTRTQEDEEE